MAYMDVGGFSSDEEALAPPVATPLPGWKRFKKLGAVILGFGMILGVGLAIGHSLGPKEFDWDDLSQQHPGFVNYESVEVPTLFQNHPRPCEAAIVDSVCALIHAQNLETFPNAYMAGFVHAKALTEVLSVSVNTIRDLFLQLDLTNFDEKNAEAYQVSCQRLCETLVASLPPKTVANRVNVGCYRDPAQFVFPGQKPDVKCDVDVSPERLAKLKFSNRTHSKAAEEIELKLSPDGKTQDTIDLALNQAGTGTSTQLQKQIVERVTYSHENWEAVRHNLLGLFRIHPEIAATTKDAGWNSMGGPAEPPNKRRLSERRKLTAEWETKTLQNAVIAQAFIDQALSKMDARVIPAVVIKWFGQNDDDVTRAEVIRVLNAVRSMLGNVQYVFPGDQCQANMYAYVYPNPPWNQNGHGQFIFYLCDYYINTDTNDQIETLTHEGSHHAASSTGDEESPINGQTMYGTASCSAVAQQCAAQGLASVDCERARKNADSYCFFINEAAASQTAAGEEGF